MPALKSVRMTADAAFWHQDDGQGRPVCKKAVTFALVTLFDRAVNCPDCLLWLVRQAAPNWAIEDVLKKD